VAVTEGAFLKASAAFDRINGQVHALAHPFAEMLPVSGASVSTFGPLLAAETVSATDARAGRIDEVQFDLGQGPCWDALSTRRPVLEPDLATSASWPAFTDAVRNEGVAAIFAFPLVLGPLEIGAVDLYSATRVALTTEEQRQALALSAVVSRLVLRHVVDDRRSEMPSPFSRRLIHQATGMVLTQMGISADDAYLIIQARAFAEGRPMRDVAEDVIERRIRFDTRTEDGGGRL
jgi:GAF domain-containing protein